MNNKQVVPGRNILENISIVWMVEDWLTFSKFQALFLMLDYEKAFDRVKHGYLWAAKAKLGLDNSFIRLVQGLVIGTTSKLHLNGLFMGEIMITRGVR